MKTYKFFRGLLKASAFATVMFVMQACYGAPHDPYFEEDEDFEQVDDTIQDLNSNLPEDLEVE